MDAAASESCETNTVQPRRRLSTLAAIPLAILLWSMPLTAGRYLRRSGWLAVLIAHLAMLWFGAGAIIIDQWYLLVPQTAGVWQPGPPNYSPNSLTEVIRIPFVGLVDFMHGGKTLGAGVGKIVIVIAIYEAALLFLAILVTPFAATHMGGWRDWARCLKMSLWCSTFLLPVGVVWALESVWRPWIGLPPYWHPVDVGVLSAVGVWWIIMLARSVRADETESWQPPDERRCERCGYSIFGLNECSRCPECGADVAESLSSRRDYPPADYSPNWIARFGYCCRTVWLVLTDKNFFKQLSIGRSYSLGGTVVVTIALFDALLLLSGFMVFNFRFHTQDDDSYSFFYLTTLFWFVMHFVGVVTLLLYGQIVRRQLAIPLATAAMHCVVLMVPFTFSIVLLLLGIKAFLILEPQRNWWEHGLIIALPTAAVSSVVVQFPVVLRLIRSALTDVQYANS